MTKKDDVFQINGRIIDRATGRGVAGARVEAWDKDLICDDLVGSAVTDAQGAFRMQFDESYFRESFLDRKPEFFFKVFQDGGCIHSTEDSVLWNAETETSEITIEVEVAGQQTPPPTPTQPLEPPSLEVRGTVRLFDGSPAEKVTVSAFDRDLRSEQLLGQTETDEKGFYRVRYSADQTLKDEKGGADLLVKATASDGSLLVASQVLFNAPPVAEVDLNIPAEALEPPSLFEKVERELKPLTAGLQIEELEEDKQNQDLSFLSGETGFDIKVLARFVLAHRLKQRRLEAEFWFALLGGTFFDYTRDKSLAEQLDAILDSLPSLDAAAVRRSLISALNRREISESFRERTDEWVEAFLQFAARQLVSDSGKPGFVKQALEDARITDAKKQETFARLFTEQKSLTPELIEALEKDTSFQKEEIDDLRTSFRLAELTRGDFPLVKAIKDEFGVRQPEKIRTLAKRSEREWVELVKAKKETGEIKLPIETAETPGFGKLPDEELYGRTLERQFREAFPTAAFAGSLGRAVQNGGARGLRQARLLGGFLERHEDFELLHTPVEDFLKSGADPDTRRLASNEDFKLELKAVQRVFKLSPTFEATDALLADDLHSAQQVYRLGKTEFVRRYNGRGFTAESAAQAWDRAADTHAAVLTIVSDLKALEPGTLPQALTSDGKEAFKSFPNWESLFQTGDLCACEHCRSVLSPAAYFADLLMFLKDRKADNPAFTVKDILFSRRPDLGYLELNCENALTPLPYIDVVCEVLEDVVAAGENDLELVGLTSIPDDTPATKTALVNALAALNVSLGADFSLSQVDTANPDLWVAHGDDVTYLLKKKATPNFFAEVLRNTKASADELRAYPQYVNPKAYDKLREARFPSALPFDLFGEEVRAAMQKTNLQRWDLMRAFRNTVAPNNPTDGEIAAEYFGISADAAALFDEKRLILLADATVAGQQTVWGEAGNVNWLTAVGNVRNFLQKTGLEYNELLTLLDLEFINPDKDIFITHQDASCDTDKKDIQVLDETKLDRIHRFLRLWRKLKGWKMWEVDLVVRHKAIGNNSLDEAFLINLMQFAEVKKRLGTKATIEQVAALFGNLNTTTHFTKLHEKREDALYQKLFLNRKLIKPLDPDFELNPVTGDLDAGETVTAHQPVVLAALGLREADLVILKGLTKASDATPYINDDLTLSNLSFLWRHSWLAKLLKLKVDDWRILLKIFNQDVHSFSSPQSALEFLENIERIKATGFKPDELNWLLAADRTAKAAVRETDAARFLAALRKELQAIQAEHDPAQYFFLVPDPPAPPTDEAQLTGLLTALLQKLNRNEAEVNLFVSALRGSVRLETPLQDLPSGFTFPASITTAPHHIPIAYDEPNLLLRFDGMMTDAQRTTLLTDGSLAAVTSNPAYASAVEELFQLSQAAPATYATVEIEVALPGLTLPADRPSLPIRYNAATQKLSFTGIMSDAERLALIAEGNPSAVINELFRIPRLALKFYEPLFSAPLAALPSNVNFKEQLPAELAARIEYDVEQRLLRFKGIMTGNERAALDALVPNLLPVENEYHNAVNSLATQPQTVVAPDERIWLEEADLDATLPSNDTLAERLAKAAVKALGYLSKTLAANVIVQQSAAHLGLTEAVTRYLLTQYDVLPAPPNQTLLLHLLVDFASTTGVIDYATRKSTFDGWFWAHRVATILKKWKLTLEEIELLSGLTVAAQLLDFLTLPLDELEPVAPVERFMRTGRLLRLRDSLPETQITLLEVLEKLNAGAYAAAADFAADVELLNEAWLGADVLALINALDLVYPNDYLLAESWERLRRAFYFIDNLNAGLETVKTFAAATMREAHTKTLKELLRSKFGAETWLTLSAEIQDVLRERKRDALSAYILTHAPVAPTPPSGRWESANDLYAFYLLDVEMSACQLTSRLVQASGSVQLFVQRCLMALEPEVVVKADGVDGDSAWRWWKWMRKYRVWEANRKVFLWPENWIEPELRREKSQFFSDLENELLQNEVTQYNVEAALQSYLEKLHDVAQLEIAGFYHEDDGDNVILHVFGRTTGTEPHLYYYRRYDYRQWTPWEKVELEIQGDYLVPAVIAKRLFLFWPVFKEVPDEEGNSKVNTPNLSQSDFSVPKTKKKLQLQMAVSDYRQGKWSPKKVSKDFAETFPYDVDIVKSHYHFFPIDRSDVDGRFGIKFEGYSVDRNGNARASLDGAFEIAGCKGVPELSDLPGNFFHSVRPETDSTGSDTILMKWLELGPNPPRLDSPQNDFTLFTFSLTNSSTPTTVLNRTPWHFRMTPPWHLSYFDKMLLDGFAGLGALSHTLAERSPISRGTWLPFFYNDKKRTFFVLPVLQALRGRQEPDGGAARSYYPDIKKWFRQLEDFFEGQIQTALDAWNLSTLTPAARQQLEQYLQLQLEEEAFPPYTDGQVKSMLKKFFMRFVHFYLGFMAGVLFQFRRFHFKNFYHPFVCDFAKLVYNPLKGIAAMMSRETQLKNSGFKFLQSYQPTLSVIDPPSEDSYPKEVVDFTPDGAYSSYNWELFFHVPLLIANSLSKNQRFEEAREWYHFIFNPIGVEGPVTGGSAMSKYWITKPFFETTDPEYVQQRIDNILRMLAGDTSLPGFSAQLKKELEDQVLDWRTNPFEPHRIANYRTVAYQKTVVMKYLDNLIAWGDYLFRQDSMESINEATQLYILAAEILGARPKRIPPQAKPPVESFNEMEKEFDKFSNALVEVENLVPPLPGNAPDGADPAPLPMLYFCIPQNDKMLGYWDTIADRLYKIRHCMNIEGVVRQLALFEPPIDPGALVKAVAGGLDIGAALADLNAPLPLYRFNVMLQAANEVCNDVKGLGNALLAALEKKDAEALGLLRQSHEVRILEAVKAIKEKQIEEAKENLTGVKKSKVVAETRRNYYRDIERLSAQERLNLDKLADAQTKQNIAQGVKLSAAAISFLPAINLGATGFGGSPVATFKIGGLELGQAAGFASDVLTMLAGISTYEASKAATQGGFDRRWEEWKLQERIAEREMEQLDSQIATAELRLAVAEKELDNHNLQMENSRAMDLFMRSKYTNQELYQWQVGQISGVYFQSYRLAYDLAKRAERCFRFELGLQDSSFINFGYWDSLKKGLLSGEKLQYDLRRLEAAYLEQHRREFELNKHVSLAQLDPLALVKLRETGRCFFRMPEEIFDHDYPGHYFRRIKSVSLTLPGVVGPYTTISCTLRLLKNSIRINTAEGDNGYEHNTDDEGLPSDDTRFVENNVPVKAIAASSAQNDSGVFELSFRDERYLPFEGAGAISDWSLELFSDLPANNPDPANPDFGKPLRQFDYNSISDAIVHVRYTAREDAGPFKNRAVAHLRDYFSEDGTTPSLRLFNLRQEFPDRWHRFLNPTNPLDGNVLEIEMSTRLFPLKDATKTLKINTIWLLARCTDTGNYQVVMNPPLSTPPAGADTFTLARVNQYGGLHFSQKDVSTPGIEIVPTDAPLTWRAEMTRPGGGNLQADPVTGVMEVEDFLMVLGYEWE
jgi:hypothetical protein